MGVRLPFFHYTHLESLEGIVKEGAIRSRKHLLNAAKSIKEISIDPDQTWRTTIGLTDYVPAFAGFYSWYRRNYALYEHLRDNYDDPQVANPSFYGTLNKVLQFKLGNRYEEVIIFLIRDEVVYHLADEGKVRMFSDISLKSGADEIQISNRNQLRECLSAEVKHRRLYCEVDLFDGNQGPISFPNDVEAIIVDNGSIAKLVQRKLHTLPNKIPNQPRLFVEELPRNDPEET